MYENRKFLIFPVTELDKVDFNQVGEKSVETLRKSVDEAKTFIKCDNDDSSFISDLLNTEGSYSYDEILSMLSTGEWSKPMPEMI